MSQHRLANDLRNANFPDPYYILFTGKTALGKPIYVFGWGTGASAPSDIVCRYWISHGSPTRIYVQSSDDLDNPTYTEVPNSDTVLTAAGGYVPVERATDVTDPVSSDDINKLIVVTGSDESALVELPDATSLPDGKSIGVANFGLLCDVTIRRNGFDDFVFSHAPGELIFFVAVGGKWRIDRRKLNGVGGLLVSSGSPSDSVGMDGDFAIDPDTGMFYGPKASGTWPTGTSLTGGSSILNGSGAPGAETGSEGDFYIDTDTSTLYGPKTDATPDPWGVGTDLGGGAGDGPAWLDIVEVDAGDGGATLDETAFNKLIKLSGSGGLVEIILPLSSEENKGQKIGVLNVSSAMQLQIHGAASLTTPYAYQTVDGDTYGITFEYGEDTYQHWVLTSLGDGWAIESRLIPSNMVQSTFNRGNLTSSMGTVTVSASNLGYVIRVRPNGSPAAVNLPEITDAILGQWITLVNDESEVLTLTPYGGQYIGGDSTNTEMATAYDSMTLMADKDVGFTPNYRWIVTAKNIAPLGT